MIRRYPLFQPTVTEQLLFSPLLLSHLSNPSRKDKRIKDTSSIKTTTFLSILIKAILRFLPREAPRFCPLAQ
jgi:hypothetical protein